jgi:putative glutamine amidotransferase
MSGIPGRESSAMKARSPLIGVTPGYAGPSTDRNFCRTAEIIYSDLNYLRRVEESGGLAVLLSHTERDNGFAQLSLQLDGLLLSGGDDVHPGRYGQELEFDNLSLSKARDDFEVGLIQAFVPTGKPILAICRGIQVLNVALGGTLLQDIPNQVGSMHHSQSVPSTQPTHKVRILEDSRIHRIFGCNLLDVNSHHHQAIDRAAPGLKIVARSEEGVIEAVEHEDHPYMIAVQWHPERLALEIDVQKRLFADFVNACGDSHGR